MQIQGACVRKHPLKRSLHLLLLRNSQSEVKILIPWLGVLVYIHITHLYVGTSLERQDGVVV